MRETTSQTESTTPSSRAGWLARLRGPLGATAVVGVLTIATAGAAFSAEAPTWKEFKASAFQDDDGTYVVNGDEPAFNVGELQEFYDRMTNEQHGHTDPLSLVVNRVNGKDDKWSATAALNITYCINTASFGTQASTVATAITNAAAAWQAAAKVKFVYKSAQNGNCTKTNSNVVFDVRQVTTSAYLARAFFPSSARTNRELLVSSYAFQTGNSWSLTGILRHELGHTLGFRHEHTRPEAGTCFEDSNWRALTSYDSASVMHYPECNGTNTGDLVLTDKDKYGAKALYGAP